MGKNGEMDRKLRQVGQVGQVGEVGELGQVEHVGRTNLLKHTY